MEGLGWCKGGSGRRMEVGVIPERQLGVSAGEGVGMWPLDRIPDLVPSCMAPIWAVRFSQTCARYFMGTDLRNP